MKNVITIDVEDWFHVCGCEPETLPGNLPKRVRPNVEKILSLLAEYDVAATFFVLGSLAEDDPTLVPMIAEAGHEIASHGYSHRLLTRLGPDEFRHELKLTGDIIKRQTGRRPAGFRAPQWSLKMTDSWAYDILHDEGYLYDSSLNPLPLVGDGSGPLFPFGVRNGKVDMVELPPMVTPTAAGNLPTGGGWGFRFFPLRMIRSTIRRYNHSGAAAILYLHPREMESDGPRLPLPPLRKFATYGPRTEAGGRLRNLLENFRFQTMEQLASSWQSA
ncbi:MAG: polysaccharide deacetylase family protein [Geobacteraceae bacterium]|nr:polysaccharide deacetylase family protein [Geobacteraceae bacterium]